MSWGLRVLGSCGLGAWGLDFGVLGLGAWFLGLGVMVSWGLCVLRVLGVWGLGFLGLGSWGLGAWCDGDVGIK